MRWEGPEEGSKEGEDRLLGGFPKPSQGRGRLGDHPVHETTAFGGGPHYPASGGDGKPTRGQGGDVDGDLLPGAHPYVGEEGTPDPLGTAYREVIGLVVQRALRSALQEEPRRRRHRPPGHPLRVRLGPEQDCGAH